MVLLCSRKWKPFSQKDVRRVGIEPTTTQEMRNDKLQPSVMPTRPSPVRLHAYGRTTITLWSCYMVQQIVRIDLGGSANHDLRQIFTEDDDLIAHRANLGIRLRLAVEAICLRVLEGRKDARPSPWAQRVHQSLQRATPDVPAQRCRHPQTRWIHPPRFQTEHQSILDRIQDAEIGERVDFLRPCALPLFFSTGRKFLSLISASGII